MSPSPTDTYQVIARRYRPQTFADVIGQEPIVTTLKNALRFHRLAHAYLFCGCRGTGKTTLARVFSKALNCQQLTSEFEPCNKCQSCQEVSQGRSLDVMEIDGASHRGIDDIRQINETIGYAPSSGKYKIYIIDEVHMLTKEAFNALLKTLEEPPANVKFFFATTEPHKVLSTIMSRCQRFDLSRITFPLIQEKLSKIAQDLSVICEEEALQLIAKLSEGSLRDAESLFDQVICYNEGTLTAEKVSTSLGIVSLSTFFELDAAVEEQDFSYAFVLAQKIFSSGKDLSYFLDSLVEHFRTVLAFQLNQAPHLSALYNKKYTHSSSAIYSQEQCLYILDYLLGWIQQMSKSTFKRISIEMILLHIIRSKKRIPIDTLVRRLHEIQKTLPSFDKKPEALPSPTSVKVDEPKVPNTDAKIEEIQQVAIRPAPIKEEISAVEPKTTLEKPEPTSIKIDEPKVPITDAKIEEILQEAMKPDPIKEVVEEEKPAATAESVSLDKEPLSQETEAVSLPEAPAAPQPIVVENVVEEPKQPVVAAVEKVAEKSPIIAEVMKQPEPPAVVTMQTPAAAVEQLLDLPIDKPAAPALAPEAVLVKELPVAPAKPAPIAKEPEAPKTYKPQIKHETIIRFAAVELDGVFSKN